METVRKINDELAIAGQVSVEELKHSVEDGFRSVLNLRSPNEEGFLTQEQQIAESLGLCYVNIPISVEGLDAALVTQVLQRLDRLPKPALVHCNTAMRAAAIALIRIATRQGIPLDRAFDQVQELGLFELWTPEARRTGGN